MICKQVTIEVELTTTEFTNELLKMGPLDVAGLLRIAMRRLDGAWLKELQVFFPLSFHEYVRDVAVFAALVQNVAPVPTVKPNKP